MLQGEERWWWIGYFDIHEATSQIFGGSMRQLLDDCEAQYERDNEVTLDIPIALTEIGKLKSLGGNFESILTTLFMPFLRKTLEFNYTVNSCDYNKFKRRFKLTTTLLSPLDELIRSDVKFILAGGKMIDFCNNLNRADSLGDYDLFFTCGYDCVYAQSILQCNGYEILSEKTHLVEMFNTELAIKVQLIKTYYSCPEDVLESFDIRACAVAYANGNIWWIDGSLRDIKDKKVIIQNIRPSKLAWLRPFKYYSKGYTIAPTDLALISVSYLMSMDSAKDIEAFPYFTDREYRYNSALDVSTYDEHLTGEIE